jgi:predicted ATPase
MLDGSQPLDHVLVIYLTRTNSTEPPPVSWTLSRTSVGLHVRRLTEDGVAAFINSCFSGRVANSEEAIASFLYGETGGSPLFLKSLMNTLLKDYVVAFDYDALQWRFDLVALQSHLSDASFDAYLESVMRRLPTDVHDMLMVSHARHHGSPVC